ncbi:Serine/threonine-protein phosphatase CPPED1 [Varanus komodoensis]|nr:Serine/threonine-protein phosphatase CPPED1 [Varanus komodoensis]
MKLKYFGHLMRRKDSLEKTLMLGTIDGKRRRGRQRIRWLDGVTEAVSVKAVFSGHYHRNAGGLHHGLDMVVSSAIGCQLGEDTHGVRVVAVTAEKIAHRYYSLDELSSPQRMEEELLALMKQN